MAAQLRTVAPDDDEMRVDRWFRQHFPQITHGRLERMLRKGEVRVDGGRVKANRRLRSGETVRIPPTLGDARAPDEPPPKLRAASEAFLRSLTLYEDEALLAINKPSGIASQGGAKIAESVDRHLQNLGAASARPVLVHRLDRDTAGLMLIAKTKPAARALTQQFRVRSVEKTYLGLLARLPSPRRGLIDAPLVKRRIDGEERMAPGRGEGAKPARTGYFVIDHAGPIAFAAMRPLTGRTHQLRAHMQAIDAPILGDSKYGREEARPLGVEDKLHLFCREMIFMHPTTGAEMKLTAPLLDPLAKTLSFFGFQAPDEFDWRGVV